MNVPDTVTTALADRPVDGRTCLEAGAGVGNMTAALVEGDAERVYAVTNDADHATEVHDRTGQARGVAVLEADLEATPLPADAVDVVTAHALFNVLEPSSAVAIAEELTRVAAPGAHLVVDDYAPIPADAAVRHLFAIENAAAELAGRRPALTFYPVDGLRHLFGGLGWEFDRTRTLLDPVPWTESHFAAHVDVVRSHAEAVPGDLGEQLVAAAEDVAAETGSEEVGEMYSLAMCLPEATSRA